MKVLTEFTEAISSPWVHTDCQMRTNVEHHFLTLKAFMGFQLLCVPNECLFISFSGAFGVWENTFVY